MGVGVQTLSQLNFCLHYLIFLIGKFFDLFHQPVVFSHSTLYAYLTQLLYNKFSVVLYSFSRNIYPFKRKKLNLLSCVHCHSLFGFVHFEEMAFLDKLYIKLVYDDIFEFLLLFSLSCLRSYQNYLLNCLSLDRK